MEKLQFTFSLLEASDRKSNILCITSIATLDGRNFEVPDEFKPANKHIYVIATEKFTKVKNSLKKRNQYRKVWITLDDNLKKTYLDEDENIQFGDQYLEEIVMENTVQNTTMVNNNNDTEYKMKNLAKVAERFTISKFSNKTSNASQWLEEFQAECARFDISQENKKIEILKFLLDKNCQDWYSSMLIKYTVESNWQTWVSNFLETFGNKGWSQVRYAFNFKYQAGSILEYATKKERLILEINRVIDDSTMIYLIVMGLPDNIMNKIDRELLKTTTDLFKEINQFEYLAKKKEIEKQKSTKSDYREPGQRIPCSICIKQKKGVRYHPENKCYFKDVDVTKKVQPANNSIDAELIEEEQKN